MPNLPLHPEGIEPAAAGGVNEGGGAYLSLGSIHGDRPDTPLSTSILTGACDGIVAIQSIRVPREI